MGCWTGFLYEIITYKEDFMENNDFDFDFKPITKGLGFHNKREKLEVRKEKKRSKKPSRKTPTSTIRKNLLEEVEIGAIYPKIKTSSTVNSLEQQKVVNFENAEKGIQVFHKVFSWLIDAFFVSLATFTASFIVLKITDNIQDFSFLVNTSNWLYLILPMFVFYYLFYFSLMWRTTRKTIGMSLWNLEIKETSKKRFSYNDSLIRSFLGLLSFLSFGILDILGVSDTITWSRIEKS